MGHVLQPDDDLLREELTIAPYDAGSSPLKLVPKKSLPHSPNYSDVMAILFWHIPKFEVLTASPPDTSNLLSITRCREDRDDFAGGTWDE